MFTGIIEATGTVASFDGKANGGVRLGVSTTLVEGDRFSVTLIPHTLAVTRLGEKMEGARVNLEGDLIAKHVANLVDHLVTARLPARGHNSEAAASPERPALTMETLRKHGFA